MFRAEFDVTGCTWAILHARGEFFENEAGGKISDFESAVEATMSHEKRLNLEDEQVVPAGHYIWFKRRGTRLVAETPVKKEWLLSSRTITTQNSVRGNASGTATPNRVRTLIQDWRPPPIDLSDAGRS
jgi:hypothetical protein